MDRCNRRKYLSLCGGGILTLSGCVGSSGAGENVNQAPLTVGDARPPDTSFTIDSIKYTVSGYTAMSTYIWTREYYAKEGGILVNIELKEENVGDSPVSVDTGGVLATSEGKTHEREKGVYGMDLSEDIPPGEEIGANILYAVPLEDTYWFFVLGDEAVHIPKTPDAEVAIEQTPEQRTISIYLGNPEYPIPETGSIMAKYEKSEGTRIEIPELDTESTVQIDFDANSDIDWRPNQILDIIWVHDRYENVTSHLGHTTLKKPE